MAVLIVSALDNVLRQLVTAEHTPHTALVVSVPSGNVIASQSTADDPAPHPFPSFYEHTDLPAPAQDIDGQHRPRISAGGSNLITQQRARAFAAVVTSMWTLERQDQGRPAASKRVASSKTIQQPPDSSQDDLMLLDTELGRIAAVQLGSFLLVLVGSRVTPWTVLDKKIRVAQDVLRHPLETVST
ncbi:hypothetical protein OIV83_002532 [Microbotryomycetes sp. JL201]|nr:hypothetical protein OIV83_002532 [Microbotryomycetes sp. JL201]